ncbi:flagellar type III secretion system pore protein FliP [Entomospira culicis]|uniref:Flagellar biosynthetic protein FliP n=1 Tax=Entomospira culicis TaxID=2719989 RepID=A0A968KV39_9SPIO|nr:flagellar type III secretion system pore protein FliP [Entomospira culicis]NIZ18492.1 flagellar type III secretion system pore protein FliP [Entomospira culicis]NIZ68708.1 flagellar type III secretion system pore protein FliP [Entomospira culicis]WDI37306.1 flagellar type III secretion system pore protein FliP [Entomospira culicis]WDI38935.1 flagellar type III secretion system pore protein FliP [Entomospira culicis]
MNKFIHLFLFLIFFTPLVSAQNFDIPLSDDGVPGGQIPIPNIGFSVTQPQSGSEMAFSVQIMLLLAVLSLAPSFIILMTSFLRISIVLDFVKRALSLQQSPPTQVINGLALFMTILIMWPTFSEVYNQAIAPAGRGEMTASQMYVQAEAPLRRFMFEQVRKNPTNIQLFMRLRGLPAPTSLADIPTYILIPAFILHELTEAFKMGIYIYIPFIIIDMVVASALMAMGMIMLPPVMISMPFKLILFVMVDGWSLLAEQLIRSFFPGG